MQKYSDTILNRQGKPVAGAVVTVTTYPGNEPATIYAADGGQPVQFVASDVNGRFAFYAADGHYNLSITGNGIDPVVITDVVLNDPSNEVSLASLAAPGGSKLIGHGDMSVSDKLDEMVSVSKYMTPEQRMNVYLRLATVDCTSAFNALWAAVKESFIDVSSEDYVTRNLLIPPGRYLISGSINWTGLKARNVNVLGWGAVLVGTGMGKNTVDLIGTRWVQIHGLTVFGDEGSMPKCGILIGPEGTTTSGNNYFNGVNVTGHFTHAALWNIGSETTTYVRSRFANYNTDPAALCYIADGRMRKGATSDYQALRTAGTAVSFTNNQFYSCDVRNMGGGSAVYLEYTRGWGFDRGCYFISFNAANFVIYTAASSTHQSLSIEGLMESAHVDTPTVGNTGCKYNVEFVGDGTNCLIEGFVFKVGVPHSTVAVFKTTSTGALNIKGADVVVGRNYVPGTPVFAAPILTMSGRIHATVAGELNLNGIVQFNGTITVDEGTPTLPPAGSYILNNTGANRLVFGGSGPYTQDGVWRAEGVATDVSWKARAKGAGSIELGNAVKTDAFVIDVPSGALHGFTATAAGSLGAPYYGVKSTTTAVNIGLRSKGSGSRVQLGNDVDANTFIEVIGQSTHPVITAAGPNPNHDLILQGKGTGVPRLPGLRDYADDTAAAAGGIPVTGLYRTGNAIKVRIA